MTTSRKTTQNEFQVFLSSFLELSYCLNQISSASLVKDISKEAELCFGISSDLMNVSFIDRGDLIGSSSLMESNIVNGSTLHVTTSRSLEVLFKSILTGDINLIVQNSLSKYFPYPNGPFHSMATKYQQDFIASRLNIALLFASSLGLAKVCNTLICLGANVNAKTKFGRTALHIAAAHPFKEVIRDLVHRGANIKVKDIFGETALDIARRYGNRHIIKQILKLSWLERCKSAKPQYSNIPLRSFQMCDSAYPKWRRNLFGQIYLQKLTPRGEYFGSRLDAPKWYWPKLDLVLTRRQMYIETRSTSNRIKCAMPFSHSN
ncbi:Ankyrin repeat domain-containing protein [Schistosoma japonicum]|uniref:Ankyrin repeat domain-containing protein n=1 Tax=Schistosoma japonicum TaxID=6182 RepID=A0A4Z2DDR7_SCHJA|nr:Ankyrin-3 [Schistosoma japonicum]TNN14609.1 Ankyrin repeat domain-containing protein [Schistosoma japonicum]